MKVSIALDPSIDEYEILIRAPRLTEELAQLQESILKKKLVGSFSLFTRIEANIFWIWQTLLFFETDGEKDLWAYQGRGL